MEMYVVITGVLVVLGIYLFKKYFIDVYEYWKRKGIPSIPRPLPVLGHSFSALYQHEHFISFINEVYESNKSRSMIGFYQLAKPNLVLLDPELIKSVLINDFSKFHVNFSDIDPSIDPLLAENPFFNYGDKWKSSRSRLSHALMSSKKLRTLGQCVTGVTKKLEKYLNECVDNSANGTFEFEAKELGNLFTGEVVSSAGFGVEGEFFTGGTGPNSFSKVVQGFLEPSTANAILQTLIIIAPKLNKIFRKPFISKKMDGFFRRVVREIVEMRRRDGLTGNDFLQGMLDDRKCDDEHGNLDLECLTAAATSFFVDGYETTAVTLGFFLYELAKEPQVQEKVREEVIGVLDRHEGRVGYDSVAEMTYMDRALSESQRLFPAVGFLKKKCNSRCKLVGFDGLECEMEPGTEIFIPVYSIHRDERYYENPEVFDPDRFLDERKKERHRTVFMPFGEGPRMCVGMRIAQLQIKAAIATILNDFSILLSTKTNEPLTFLPGTILTTVRDGIWINLKRR